MAARWWTLPEQRYIFKLFEKKTIARVSGSVVEYARRMCAPADESDDARAIAATAVLYKEAVSRLVAEFRIPERGAAKLCDLAPRSAREARAIVGGYLGDEVDDASLQRALDDIVGALPPLVGSLA